MDGSYVSSLCALRSWGDHLWNLKRNIPANRDEIGATLQQLIIISDQLPAPHQVEILRHLLYEVYLVPQYMGPSLDLQIVTRLLDLGELREGYIVCPVPRLVLAEANLRYARLGMAHGFTTPIEAAEYYRRAYELQHPFRHAALVLGVQIGAAMLEARHERRRLKRQLNRW